MQQGVHGRLEGARDTADGSADARHHLVHGVLEIRRSCALGRGQAGVRAHTASSKARPSCQVAADRAVCFSRAPPKKDTALCRLGQGASMG